MPFPLFGQMANVAARWKPWRIAGKGSIDDSRQARKVSHERLSLLRQRVLVIANGYPDGNDAAQLTRDPVLLLTCHHSPADEQSLASQPALSRFKNAARPRTLLVRAETLTDTVLAYQRGLRQFARRSAQDQV